MKILKTLFTIASIYGTFYIIDLLVKFVVYDDFPLWIGFPTAILMGLFAVMVNMYIWIKK